MPETPALVGAPPVRMVFAGTPLAVREALAEARAHWQTGGMEEQLCAAAEQVLAEVLNNVVEHALAGRGDGTIELAMVPGAGGLSCEVCDNGAPMPALVPPAGNPAEIGNRVEDLPEGGFGWFMIRALTDGLTYERRGGQNALSFRILPDRACALF